MGAKEHIWNFYKKDLQHGALINVSYPNLVTFMWSLWKFLCDHFENADVSTRSRLRQK